MKSLIEEIQAGGDARRAFDAAVARVKDDLPSLLNSLQHGESLDLIDTLRTLQPDPMTEGLTAPMRACRQGCSACCFTVAIDVTPVEAIAAAEYIQQCLSTAQVDAIRDRLKKLSMRRAMMTREETQTKRLGCGLLGMDGACMVYPARPLVCAGVHSFNQEACESAAELVALEQADGKVPIDRAAKASTMGVSGALQRALVERGLDGNLYELNSAVLCALNAPNAWQRYLGKEDLFASAHCTEAHSWPRLARTDAAHSSVVKKPNFLKRSRQRSARR
ncbi:YkgJ family cysteine cluster protein [Blastopirellula sp. JC732]|uniref:YkgJ family cysteine cluster protein n=1 Tax=Blastopirellula sediminis TaxID=2894196 RepID=A0A9X1MJE2_9BACT|nr:YkgJ family cysteine cluster protein [Blastopirellula sediminis]MCC9608185.1 YkgJ family cysteine cluster protein [Blastopirellula sediminis]MCC9627022.1 YkgJ family cysteine cluster protein [Blastopirellula sediminis]